MTDFIRDMAALAVIGAFIGMVALWSVSLTAVV
jgi:hypothetical protein